MSPPPVMVNNQKTAVRIRVTGRRFGARLLSVVSTATNIMPTEIRSVQDLTSSDSYVCRGHAAKTSLMWSRNNAFCHFHEQRETEALKPENYQQKTENSRVRNRFQLQSVLQIVIGQIPETH